jgi:hypothetical protein
MSTKSNTQLLETSWSKKPGSESWLVLSQVLMYLFDPFGIFRKFSIIGLIPFHNLGYFAGLNHCDDPNLEKEPYHRSSGTPDLVHSREVGGLRW